MKKRRDPNPRQKFVDPWIDRALVVSIRDMDLLINGVEVGLHKSFDELTSSYGLVSTSRNPTEVQNALIEKGYALAPYNVAEYVCRVQKSFKLSWSQSAIMLFCPDQDSRSGYGGQYNYTAISYTSMNEIGWTYHDKVAEFELYKNEVNFVVYKIDAGKTKLNKTK